MRLFQRKKKPLVVTIHGFGKNRSSEMDSLCAFLKSHGYDTLQFDIYDLDNGLDADWKEWLRRCERQMHEALAKNRRVILVGFSMGGVIATHLATIYNIEKLVLVAPAFRYLDLEKVTRSLASSLSGRNKTAVPSSEQTKAFREIVDNCRNSIDHVSCPVLILHGTADEVISPSSSTEFFARIPHERKRLLYLEGAHHRVLYDGQMEETADWIILDFIEGKYGL